MNEDVRVGDLVYVVNKYSLYTTYSEIFDKPELKPYATRYSFGNSYIDCDCTYIILAVVVNHRDERICVITEYYAGYAKAVEDFTPIYLIEDIGLEKK